MNPQDIKKPFVLSSTNIDKFVSSIKKQIKEVSNLPQPKALLVPRYTKTDEINRKSYRGVGRPRDKDYVRVETLELIKEFNKIITP